MEVLGFYYFFNDASMVKLRPAPEATVKMSTEMTINIASESVHVPVHSWSRPKNSGPIAANK